MVQSILNYLDKFTPEILLIQVGFLLIVISVFAFIWLQNKKRYNHLKHQIPANVVKSYLDSMIQNANSLKSSLFRGGGMDIDPNSIPSVFPLGDLGGGDQAQVMGTNSEELRLKLAEIAQLRAQLQERNGTIKEFEGNVTTLRGENRANQDRISDLEKMLGELRKGSKGGGDPTLGPELVKVKKERDDLKQRLKEYSIIEDDLANLKRLKQENEQLKRSLGQPVAEPEAASIAEAAPPVADIPQFEEPAPNPLDEMPNFETLGSEQNTEDATATFESAPDVEETVVAAAEEAPVPDAPPMAPEAPSENKNEKTPEDLLSEFEKMLG